MDYMESNTETGGLGFQQIVIIIAIILLIITLSVIGFMLTAAVQISKTPAYNACPDKWGLTGSNICTNTVKTDTYFDNVGTFISDVSCNATGASGSPNLCGHIPGWTTTGSNSCMTGWTQGNTTNGLDASNCYLLASHGTGTITTTDTPAHTYTITSPLIHKLESSLATNVNWAKAYGLSWDGLTN